jgi:hypothetical protein
MACGAWCLYAAYDLHREKAAWWGFFLLAGVAIVAYVSEKTIKDRNNEVC